jgi:putative SOS response-associated peptidase YedK
MCAQFMMKKSPRQIAAELRAKVLDEAMFEFRDRILPYGNAPVVVAENGERVLKLMRFSLLPAWSKEKRVKFSTHNARLDSVLEKPTWKNAFLKRHCLVPMTDFLEPIYEGSGDGKWAGHMVRFFEKNHSLFCAAGIWEEWEKGEVIESFSILTDDPLPFVAQIGHDRSPVFLDPEAYDGWLNPVGKTGPQMVEFLHAHKSALALDVESDRLLKGKK